jgi:hypothetical protein
MTMVFTRLGVIEIHYKMCRKVYGLAKSMTFVIVRKYCATIRKHLKPLIILNWLKIKSTKSSFQF